MFRFIKQHKLNIIAISFGSYVSYKCCMYILCDSCALASSAYAYINLIHHIINKLYCYMHLFCVLELILNTHII